MMVLNLPIDRIVPSPTGQCTNDTTMKTFNAGTVIDGFSVLADVTGQKVYRDWLAQRQLFLMYPRRLTLYQGFLLLSAPRRIQPSGKHRTVL